MDRKENMAGSDKHFEVTALLPLTVWKEREKKMFIMSFLHVSSFDRNIPKVSQKTQYIYKKNKEILIVSLVRIFNIVRRERP